MRQRKTERCAGLCEQALESAGRAAAAASEAPNPSAQSRSAPTPAVHLAACSSTSFIPACLLPNEITPWFHENQCRKGQASGVLLGRQGGEAVE